MFDLFHGEGISPRFSAAEQLQSTTKALASSQQSDEKLARASLPSSRKGAKKRLGKGASHADLVRYDSRPEAICAEFLERYVPGYKVIAHKTFQIPVYDFQSGRTRTIDFKVQGVFVEYHPPRFWKQGNHFGDFPDARSYFVYKKKLNSLKTKRGKRRFRRQTKQELSKHYKRTRKELIEGDEEHAGTPLIVVTSPGDFYSKILRKFGRDIPSREEFLAEFKERLRDLKKAA